MDVDIAKGLLFFMFCLLLSGIATFPPEICDNAIDDDGDGWVDLNDGDCKCPVLEPISRIPNPSFEENHCCPGDRSQLNCADTWIQASDPTTDYLHTCGWMGWPEFPPPLPFPDGEGAVGFRDGRYFQNMSDPNWKEYAGACLLAPLEEGVAYRFQFYIGFSDPISSPPINVNFFGNTDCKNLPFGVGNEKLGCPTNDTTGWVRLGSVFVSGSNNWVKTEIDITPDTDIYAIAIGPDCQEFERTNSTYYFFDNLVLDEQRAFEFVIREKAHPCSEDFVIGVPVLKDADYQWYKEGVALIGEKEPNLRVKTGEGKYQVRILDGRECKITQAFVYTIPTYHTVLNQYVCAGEYYTFGTEDIFTSGDYSKHFRTSNNCDSLVDLALEVVDYAPTGMKTKIFRGDQFKLGDFKTGERGNFDVFLTSSLGCDSLINLSVDYFDVYFPNIFSPDGDGVNDFFNVFGENDLRSVKEMQIYSRWGEMLFEQYDILPNTFSSGWNGDAFGEHAPAGVYVYKVLLEMEDGQQKPFYGSVTLVR